MRDLVLVVKDDKELPVFSRPLWWQERGLTKTASGYGTKIPTKNVIRYDNRFRRIYVDIFGNIGHSYFILKGEKITVR